MIKNMTQNQDLKTTTPSSQTNPKTQPSPFWQSVWENVKIVLIALVLSVIIRAFIAEPRYIPSDSMFPTLATGDRLVVEKISYHFHAPERGDIIVFEPPIQLQLQGYQKDQAFIKRIIGKPGQQIKVQEGIVYVDNQPLEEDYILQPPYYNLLPVTVPAGELFVMGDNRNNSNDSHIWGFLPQENIIGKAVWRFWPLTRIGKIYL